MIYSQPGSSFTAVLEGANTGLVGTMGVRIENTDGSNQTPRVTAGIVEVEAGSGVYTVELTAPTSAGTFVVLWDDGSGNYAPETLIVTSNSPAEIFAPPIGDLRNTEVLIPRTRRALEGPDSVNGSAAIAAGNLSDDQVNAVIADAIADVIFYTGGLFDHTLEVTARDTDYFAPTAWLIDPQMSEYEATVIVAQAALNYFFSYAKDLKVSERIADEGQEWEWKLSASVISDWIKYLMAARDRALEVVATANPALDSWINFIEVRDQQTWAIVEPWLASGQGGQLVAQSDFRFGTVDLLQG